MQGRGALREAGPVTLVKLGRAGAGLDDDDHVADGAELRAGEEHPAYAALPGLAPGDLTRIVVIEAAGEHLLAMCPIKKENVVHRKASCQTDSPIQFILVSEYRTGNRRNFLLDYG
jgi:hypothetical protein